MTNTTPLSLAANAVLDAALETWVTRDSPSSIAAAALRAVANYVPDHQMSAHMLHAIADELESQ